MRVGPRFLRRVPRSIFTFDRFYVVQCRSIAPVSRDLGVDAKMSIGPFTWEACQAIARDLPLRTSIISMHTEGKDPLGTRIIQIVNHDRSAAFTVVTPITRVISPSGFNWELEPELKAAWVFGTQIDPRFRLRGYFVHLLSGAMQAAHELGCDRLMGEIHHSNSASLRAHARLGFEVYKHIKYIRVLGRSWYWEGDRSFVYRK